RSLCDLRKNVRGPITGLSTGALEKRCRTLLPMPPISQTASEISLRATPTPRMCAAESVLRQRGIGSTDAKSLRRLIRQRESHPLISNTPNYARLLLSRPHPRRVIPLSYLDTAMTEQHGDPLHGYPGLKQGDREGIPESVGVAVWNPCPIGIQPLGCTASP